MVKRAPTPPPADDTRFFTVMNPYPQQPYIAPQDTKTFARWIACIIGQENLLAFYHKSKSPNVVLIETSRLGPDFDRLMGEHRWREFLRSSPSTSEQEASSIFPCTLATPRAAAKAGWVCRDIPDTSFREWSPAAAESPFTYPYPPPRHCDPPAEDVTRNPLCRPIPRRHESEAPPSTAQFFAARRAAPTTSADDDEEDLLAPSYSDVSDFLSVRDRFIPAIHGSDIPKASVVVIRPTTEPPAPLPNADTRADVEDDDDDEAEKGLCSAHGVLCVSGICTECAARKRQAKLAERALERGGRGRGWGQSSERDPRKEYSGMRRGDCPPQGRTVTAAPPLHLRGEGAGGKQDSSPRLRVRDDIRVEMASRAHTGMQGTRSVASSATRALPPHLGNRSNVTSKPAKARIPTSTSSSSISDASSAPPSTSAPSDDGLSESSGTSEPSSFESSSEDASPMPFRPSAVFKAPPAYPPGIRIPEAQRVASRPWGARAVVQDEDASSIDVETHVALENAWKQVRATRPAPLKPTVNVKSVISPVPVTVRDSWDDDSSEDDEPF